MKFKSIALILVWVGVTFSRLSIGESQNSDYKGITDPFGDPAKYEFAEDEKEDKEFFHLGRFLMLGADLGVALFTGGLGQTTDPGFYVGGRLEYFFDKAFCLEVAVHYSNHLDSVRPATNSTQFADIDTTMIPLTLGLRYYFDTQDAPRVIALANPYLGAGGGLYLRKQNVIGSGGGLVPDISNSTSSSFGGYAAAGVEFPVYGRHVYLGVDARFNLVFFPDRDSTWNNALNPGARSGNYFTTNATLTYNY